MSKKRRTSSESFQCPTKHVSASDIRDFFSITLGYRNCILCKCSFKIGENEKTTSSLRTHLRTKHLQELLAKHPKQQLEKTETETETKPKMNKLFDPFTIRSTQDKYDKACLLRFIINAESYSSLQNQGTLIISFRSCN
jgi:hypothetical protein